MAYTEDDSLNRENDFYKAKHEEEMAKETAFYEKHPWAKPLSPSQRQQKKNQNLSAQQFQSGPWNSGGVMYGPPAPPKENVYRGRGKQFGTSGQRNRDQLSYNAHQGRYD